MSDTPLRIAVTGLAGHVSLRRRVLGLHAVRARLSSGSAMTCSIIEDTGKWCYSPTQQTFVEAGHDNAAFLADHLRRLEPELADKWFYRDALGKTYGRSWKDVVAFCRSRRSAPAHFRILLDAR